MKITWQLVEGETLSTGIVRRLGEEGEEGEEGDTAGLGALSNIFVHTKVNIAEIVLSRFAEKKLMLRRGFKCVIIIAGLSV